MIPAVDRLYRSIFCRNGYGVHSPFAFDLITNVIEEKRGYYCYEMLDNIRLQLQRESRKIKCGDKELTVKQALNRFGFSVRGHELLFRLANRFQPEKILVAGSCLGLTPLYVTAYSKGANCIVFEPEPSVAVIARNMVKKYAHSSINIYDKLPDEFDMPALNDLDFIVWGKTPTGFFPGRKEPAAGCGSVFTADFSLSAFEHLRRYITDESVLIVSGINASCADRQTWKALCAHPMVSVTLDLHSFGIVFFTAKLTRKSYKCVHI
ncbi:MAG: hypothetical protein LBS79_08335 [Tannerella sp.]|jgi:hypothetical protein|nr:hypothetical protein [Tannerella sp.]